MKKILISTLVFAFFAIGVAKSQSVIVENTKPVPNKTLLKKSLAPQTKSPSEISETDEKTIPFGEIEIQSYKQYKNACLTYLDFPRYRDNGDQEIDIATFNAEVKQWADKNPVKSKRIIEEISKTRQAVYKGK